MMTIRTGFAAHGWQAGRRALLVLVPLAFCGLGSAPLNAQERGMVEAVMRTFDVAGRQVYLVPRFLEDGSESEQMSAVMRHAPQTISEIESTFRAKIMLPEEAIRCADVSRPETCTIPNHGIIFYFVQPRPRRPDGSLQVRLLVYQDGRGEGGQILREGWEFTLRPTTGSGWRVVNRQLVATVQGPGL
jgi:hypothetical protein